MNTRRIGAALAAVASVLMACVVAVPSAGADTGSAGVVTKAKTVPGKPLAFGVTPLNGGFLLSWKPPTSAGGAPITGYTVVATSSHEPTRSCSTTGALYCVVGPVALPGGTYGNSYIFTVVATNSFGKGKVAKATGSDVPVPHCGFLAPYADLNSCNLAGVSLAGVDLTGASLVGVSSGGVTGKPAALPAGWTLVGGYLIGPGANLVSANLDSAVLAGADLAGLDLAGAQLIAADLTGANLTGANLSTAALNDATLTNANLSGANLTGAVLSYDTLTGATLTGATLAQVTTGSLAGTPAALPTHWALVSGTLFGPAANLSQTSYAGLDLAGLDLAGANLSQSDLSTANLTGVDFTGANFSHAAFDGATVTGAVVTSVLWFNTSCPDSTNSNAHTPQTCVGDGF